MTDSTLPDLAAVIDLADELLRELTPHAGHPDDVADALDGWLDDLGPGLLAAVAMRAVYRTFADCMTAPHPDAQAPAGALALTPPEGDTAA